MILLPYLDSLCTTKGRFEMTQDERRSGYTSNIDDIQRSHDRHCMRMAITCKEKMIDFTHTKIFGRMQKHCDLFESTSAKFSISIGPMPHLIVNVALNTKNDYSECEYNFNTVKKIVGLIS
jgi:hypothetical protein